MASTHGIFSPSDLSDPALQSANFADEKQAATERVSEPARVASHNAADADLGLKILRDRSDNEPYVLEPAMRKRVLREIDLHILPILT